MGRGVDGNPVLYVLVPRFLIVLQSRVGPAASASGPRLTSEYTSAEAVDVGSGVGIRVGVNIGIGVAVPTHPGSLSAGSRGGVDPLPMPL